MTTTVSTTAYIVAFLLAALGGGLIQGIGDSNVTSRAFLLYFGVVVALCIAFSVAINQQLAKQALTNDEFGGAILTGLAAALASLLVITVAIQLSSIALVSSILVGVHMLLVFGAVVLIARSASPRRHSTE